MSKLHHPKITRAGFSLIEVLISVMILSLGLLGLAAVFPVIVRQQRLSGDATQGLIVSKSAEAYIRSHELMNRRSKTSAVIPLIQDRRGWDLWRFGCVDNNGIISPDATYRNQTAGAVRIPQLWDVRGFMPGDPVMGLSLDRTANDRGDDYVFGTGILTNPPRAFEEPVIPLGDRLWPAPYSAMDGNWKDTKYANEPRFVWDIALMRDEAGTAGALTDDRVRVAVFVRRIDTGIRLPAREVQDDTFDPLALEAQTQNGRPSSVTGQYRTVRMADVLLRNSTTALSPTRRTRLLSTDENRVPIGVDANATIADAMPTLDGNGNYAALKTCFVEAFEDPQSPTGTNYTRLVLQPSLSTSQLNMLRQPNQRFADNLGNIYTVVKLDDTNPNALIITPPAPIAVRDLTVLRPSFAVQIVFSPVPPANISIFTVDLK
jgi:prepilin-type N-terminal cleavage/methylation domain-containing protein